MYFVKQIECVIQKNGAFEYVKTYVALCMKA